MLESRHVHVLNDEHRALAQAGAGADRPAERIAVTGGEAGVDVHQQGGAARYQRGIEPHRHRQFVPHRIGLTVLGQVRIERGMPCGQLAEELGLEECAGGRIDRHLRNLLPRLVQHDRRRLGIKAHIEFPPRRIDVFGGKGIVRRHRVVAASHEHQFLRQGRKLRVEPGRQREIGQRAGRDDGDLPWKFTHLSHQKTGRALGQGLDRGCTRR